MKFNTKYKYEKVSGFHFNKPSLTDQSQSCDADINNIVNSMAIVPQQAQPPQFGSTFNPDMFQDALNVVAIAKSQFENMPAAIRREFDNDIQKFVEFYDKAASDELTAQKAVKMGLFKPELLETFKKVDISPIQPTEQSVNQTASGSSAVSE